MAAIQFHLDEHIHPGVVYGLRARGIDVTTAAEAGLLGEDDADHLEFAAVGERVMVTHDDDFLRLHGQGLPHAGIAYCHQDKYTIGKLLQMLLLLHACYDGDEMKGCLEFL